MIVILLAGAAAQRRFAPKSWRAAHGSSDRHEAVGLALSINGSPELATAHLKYLDLKAKAVVDHRWFQVEAVARELLTVGTLDRGAFDDVLARTIARKPVAAIVDGKTVMI